MTFWGVICSILSILIVKPDLNTRERHSWRGGRRPVGVGRDTERDVPKEGGAAVDLEGGAGYVRGRVREQEAHRRRHLPRVEYSGRGVQAQSHIINRDTRAIVRNLSQSYFFFARWVGSSVLVITTHKHTRKHIQVRTKTSTRQTGRDANLVGHAEALGGNP